MLLAQGGKKQVPRLGGRCASELSSIARNDSSEATDIVADGLLLLSYPLHPPGRPDQMRTQHLPQLEVPTLFVEGTKDPFATVEEIEAARKLVAARTDLLIVEGAGHDLGFAGKKRRDQLPAMVVARFREFFGM
jgi:predicted alpha/beta-hydrolase family hydrolase